MIVPVTKRDLATLANIANGKNPGVTSVVEASYKDGVFTLAATDADIVAVIVQPGFTPDDIQLLNTDLESYYLYSDSLKETLKQIPRSKRTVYLSIERETCEIVTDETTYEIDMRAVNDPALVSRYAKLRDDHRYFDKTTACTIKSNVLAKAVKAAHELAYSETIEFRVLKRATSPVLQWVSARPDRGFVKVVTIAKYAFKED